MVTVPQIIRKAREILKRDGWTKDKFADPETGAVCALGAVNRALYEFAKDDPIIGKFATNEDGDFYIGVDDEGYYDGVDSEALALAERWNAMRQKAEDVLTSEVRNLSPTAMSVPSFNDDPKTTFSKVLDLFSRALTRVKGGV